MDGQSRNLWKIFGIIVIVVAIVAAAFLIGRGCERKKNEDSKTTPTATQAAPAATPSSDDSSSGSNQPSDDTQNVVTVEDDGETVTVVSTHDTVGPCVGGFQNVTHTTEYSNGTSASSISRQACDEGVIEPVPEPAP
ncbi:MAG: hypothetical protein Q7K29_03260 [Thermoleophilia bacterium]|nr:hypothetical protein [Thermoleophilia bacterium]